MANLVIVAIPSTEDDIWQESSEQVPHMTILFLGDAMSNPNVTKITEKVKQAAQYLEPFSLVVDHRGFLGPDNADVLFFEDEWDDLPWQLNDFRDSLLRDINVKSAYNSQPQYVEWDPHITLGYPETPAKEYKLDPGETDYITFDRVAVWYGDYEGTEVTLTVNNKLSNYSDDVPISDAAWSTPMINILSHHGTKGMKWGVRRGVGKPTAVTVTQKGKKLKTSGGKNQPAHKDAVAARTLGQKAKGSGVHSLSNKELQTYSNRLNMEQNVKRLQANDKSGARRFIAGVLGQTGKNQVNAIANDAAKKAVAKTLLKGAVVAAV